MLRLCIIAILVQQCHSWTFNTTHTQVQENRTKNVTIGCYFNNYSHDKSPIKEVTRILIHKYQKDKDAPWFTFAKVYYGASRPVLVYQGAGNVSLSGRAYDSSSSYLSVTWSLSSKDTPGQYACEVNGFSVEDLAIKVITKAVSIVEANLEFKDLLNMFLNFEKRSKQFQTQIQKDMTKMKTEMKYELRNFRQEIVNLRDNMTEMKAEFKSQSSDFKQEIDSLREVKSELRNVKEEIVSLGGNMTEMKTEVKSMSEDFKRKIDSLRDDVTKINTDVKSESADFKQEIENLRDNMTEMTNGVKSQCTDFKQEIDSLRDNVTKMSTEVRSESTNLKQEIGSLRDKMTEMKTEVETEFRNFRQEIDSLRENVTDCVDEYKELKWPCGSYALLKAEGECPASPTSPLLEGYARFHTESSRYPNNDSISDPSHMATPVHGRNNSQNVFYIRTCSQRSRSDTCGAWPEGSYCIHRFGGVCPPGFNDGEIQVDVEDTNTLSFEKTNYGPDSIVKRLYFCCRNDLEATKPIVLPVETPFFLYRYKGQCQEVANANVNEEWFLMDTEDDRNNDAVLDAYHPDLTLNPIKFKTCYYRKNAL